MDTSIKQLIHKIAAKSSPEIVIGVVMKTDPLEIVLKDDPNIRIHMASLYIPGNRLPIEEGEKLFLLSRRNQKMYYVMDRVETWRPWRKS